MRIAIALVLVIAGEVDARAGNDSLANWLVGPVVGVRLDRGPGSKLVIGLEGGGGYGPERFNLGFEHRDDVDAEYLEIDPWFFVGGTLGLAHDSHGDTQPVLGVWEGFPIFNNTGHCTGWHSEVTISGGYRFTGAHELYVSVKAGMLEGNFCFD